MSLPTPSPASTAIVTGASSGIGIEIARELVRRGHGVTLVARRGDKLRELAAELARSGLRIEVLAADLTVAAERADLIPTVEARGLTVDILVNNAGISTSGPVHRGDPSAELSVVATNVAAVVDLCTRALPGMVGRGRGAILNVASTAAFQPVPGQATYGASKAFVVSYTYGVGAELRGTGVAMTALCPGPVDTGFGERAGITLEEAQLLPAFMWVSPAKVARLAVDGLDKGRPIVIPGASNRASAVFAQLTPRRWLVPILARSHPSLK